MDLDACVDCLHMFQFKTRSMVKASELVSYRFLPQRVIRYRLLVMPENIFILDMVPEF